MLGSSVQAVAPAPRAFATRRQRPARLLACPQPAPAASHQRSFRLCAAEADADAAASGDAPWQVGVYYTKRPVHRTDALGGIPEESMDNLVDMPGWDETGKLRLAISVVARELGLDEAVVNSRLEALRVLVPDLGARMSTMRPGDLARLAASVSDVAAAMLRLRDIFPRANVSAMVARRPELLSMRAEEVQARAVALRQLLPGKDADSAAAEQPRLLDVDNTRAALAELRRLMPGLDVETMLVNDTSLLSSVDTGPSLITYDNGTLAQLRETLTGGPGAAPEGW